MSSIQRILVIGPAWVGDMVMAQVLFKLLKRRQPQVKIDVLAPGWTHPLLTRMPEVNAALISPFKHEELLLSQRYRLGLSLRKKAYDQAIILPNSFKSALLPWAAKIPRRTGWRGEWRYGLLNDLRILNKSRYPLMIERFMALGLDKNEPLPTEYERPLLVVANESIAATLNKQQLAFPSGQVLALCPGAEFGPAKQWPPEYYAAVAKAKINQGWQVWILGSAKDKVVGDTINQLSGKQCINLAGTTTLDEAVDLLSLATLVLTNDSGLMHVAAALQRPLLAVYGSSSPHFTPPLSDMAQILRLSLECSPCFKRVCPLGHFKCMKDLLPQQILDHFPA